MKGMIYFSIGALYFFLGYTFVLRDNQSLFGLTEHLHSWLPENMIDILLLTLVFAPSAVALYQANVFLDTDKEIPTGCYQIICKLLLGILAASYFALLISHLFW